MFKTLRLTDPEDLIKQRKPVGRGLAIFERELEERGTDYFGFPDRPGMLDYNIWPWFERFPFFNQAVGIDTKPFPKLVSTLLNTSPS